MSHKAERQRKSKNRQRRKRAERAATVIAMPMAGRMQPAAGNAAPALLQTLADALNAVESSGIHVQLVNGAVITEYGYVFDFGCAGVDGEETWQVRTRMLTEFSFMPLEADLVRFRDVQAYITVVERDNCGLPVA